MIEVCVTGSEDTMKKLVIEVEKLKIDFKEIIHLLGEKKRKRCASQRK